jgi:hypothetical protein
MLESASKTEGKALGLLKERMLRLNCSTDRTSTPRHVMQSEPLNVPRLGGLRVAGPGVGSSHCSSFRYWILGVGIGEVRCNMGLL